MKKGQVVQRVILLLSKLLQARDEPVRKSQLCRNSYLQYSTGHRTQVTTHTTVSARVVGRDGCRAGEEEEEESQSEQGMRIVPILEPSPSSSLSLSQCCRAAAD